MQPDGTYDNELVDSADSEVRVTDEEIKQRQGDELQAERDYRNERLGIGPAAGATPAPGFVTAPNAPAPESAPEEPTTFDENVDENADETTADFDTDTDEDDEPREGQEVHA
jgi:hypothetical protein